MKNLLKIISEELTNTLKEYNKLGRGAFGKVFEKDGFAYKVTTDTDEIEFSNKILLNQGKVTSFPKIYWIKNLPDSEYTIIKRELVKLPNPTKAAYINSLTYKIFSYVKWGEEETLHELKKTNLGDKFINFLIGLRKDSEFLGGKQEDIDIHGYNVGINKEGNYVLFDY